MYDIGLEDHNLVTEKTGAPKQPRRRLQRTYTKSHHNWGSCVPQLALLVQATCVSLWSFGERLVLKTQAQGFWLGIWKYKDWVRKRERERERVIWAVGKRKLWSPELEIPARKLVFLLHSFFFVCVASRCFLQLKLTEVSLAAFILVPRVLND